MFGFKKRTIAELGESLPRAELVNRSRILVIDDEAPSLLQDLKDYGFAVDHVSDINSQVSGSIEQCRYDLILLDFGEVGTTFGDDEGLSLLKHIKAISPSTIVFAYTSKALRSCHADFYVLSDGNLDKDAGVQESIEKIVEGLKKSRSVSNTWKSFLHRCAIAPGTADDLRLQDAFVRAVESPKKHSYWKTVALDAAKSDEGKAVVSAIASKLLELGAQAI
ncbi:hypothetical protein [Rhodopirellula sp. P2]|uniref:hypothetical protein n=1 Tax=Rhodopirellula sp. P2 TaxID=2127060 RepID=UPI0023677BE6|nr:hypothetical protein [Rhodopirellula sp. P2]WDQ14578.1 hypothetical protein PSR62_13075 [Rhodopirellula sp. P2]